MAVFNLYKHSIENDKSIQYLIDLVAHKIPKLKVLKMNLGPKDTSSLLAQGKLIHLGNSLPISVYRQVLNCKYMVVAMEILPGNNRELCEQASGISSNQSFTKQNFTGCRRSRVFCQ